MILFSLLNLFRRPRCTTCEKKIPKSKMQWFLWRKGRLKQFCYRCYMAETMGFHD